MSVQENYRTYCQAYYTKKARPRIIRLPKIKFISVSKFISVFKFIIVIGAALMTTVVIFKGVFS